MSLGTSNRDGGKTSESGHLRGVTKAWRGEVIAGLKASQRAAGTNMSVDISVGDAIIPRSDGTYSHPAWNDAVYNQAIAAADGSNPRRDIVVMYIDYGEAPSTAVSNNTNGVVKIKVVAGTPAGSPSDPNDAAIQSSVGSGNPFIKLARVRVGAGVTTIGDSVIDDLRTFGYSRKHPGIVDEFAGTMAPVGTIFAYGQSVLRADYPELFAVIGTTYGAVDGTHFNIPDLRGRVVAGKDDMGGASANRLTNQSGGVDGDVLGGAGGAETHTLTTAQQASHTHGLNKAATAGGDGSGMAYSSTSLNNTTGVNSSGGGGAHNNVQPTFILNKVIYY